MVMTRSGRRTSVELKDENDTTAASTSSTSAQEQLECKYPPAVPEDTAQKLKMRNSGTDNVPERGYCYLSKPEPPPEREETFHSEVSTSLECSPQQRSSFMKNKGRVGSHDNGVVIGQNLIAVDQFSVYNICKYYFLTHAHVEIHRRFIESCTKPIYCSELTATIQTLSSRKRVPRFHSLKVGVQYELEPGLQVTLLDAHHCFGSVMLLFEGSLVPGGSILCTGHFRADRSMLSRFDFDPLFKKLAQTYISTIYLDDTYLSYPVPSCLERIDSIKRVINELRGLSRHTVIIPVRKVGVEKLLEKVSQALSEPMATNPAKLAVMRACGLSVANLTIGYDTARIRTISRSSYWGSYWGITNALKQVRKPVVILDLSVDGECKKMFPNKNVRNIPYYDHSSPGEIESFLAKLNFGKVVSQTGEGSVINLNLNIDPSIRDRQEHSNTQRGDMEESLRVESQRNTSEDSQESDDGEESASAEVLTAPKNRSMERYSSTKQEYRRMHMQSRLERRKFAESRKSNQEYLAEWRRQRRSINTEAGTSKPLDRSLLAGYGPSLPAPAGESHHTFYNELKRLLKSELYSGYSQSEQKPTPLSQPCP